MAGGHIEATYIPVGDVHPMVKAGKLSMLAVAMQERHYLHPDVPTMKELKVNLDTGNWVGFIAPKGVPEAIIAKLDRAIEKALKSPEVVSSWREMGNVTTYLNYKDFAKWLVPHAAETRALVESMGLLVVPAKQ